MILVFWQNMVSIHQSALMRALATKHEVTLVVEQLCEQARVDSGWIIPDIGNTRIVVAPTDAEIHELLALDNDCVHIFTGMRAFPMVTKAFKQAVRRKLFVGLYMEPFDPTGWKGKIRKIVYQLLALRYRHNVSFVLATGKTGLQCYRSSGFSDLQVFEWGYFTEHPAHYKIKDARFDKTILLFIGQLISRKSILPFIQTFKELPNSSSCELHIIGDGVQKNELIAAIDGHSNIKYLGNVPNKEISKHLQSCDLMVLPSIHDGWGAVVNEALQSGCRVLCSTACGAASLLDGEIRGSTFDWNTPDDLSDKLQYWVNKGKLTSNTRDNIQNWAKQNISGESAANYLEIIVQFCKSKKLTTRPTPPWK